MARILLIEDSPTEAAVITQLLERNGHQVTTSGSAEDGIARVQLWTASAGQTPSDTAEMKSRGKDQLAAGALVVEAIRRADAERVAVKVADQPPAELGISGPSVVGIYALLCVYPGAKALTVA